MAMFKNIFQKLEEILFVALFIHLIVLSVFLGTIIYKDITSNEKDIENNIKSSKKFKS